jgi:hypothetical protein
MRQLDNMIQAFQSREKIFDTIQKFSKKYIRKKTKQEENELEAIVAKISKFFLFNHLQL